MTIETPFLMILKMILAMEFLKTSLTQTIKFKSKLRKKMMDLFQCPQPKLTSEIKAWMILRKPCPLQPIISFKIIIQTWKSSQITLTCSLIWILMLSNLKTIKLIFLQNKSQQKTLPLLKIRNMIDRYEGSIYLCNINFF